MKLLASIATAISATQTGLEPLQSIAMAHGRVRQAYTIPEMDFITEQNERLIAEVFSESFSQRLTSFEDVVAQSNNITSQFRAQGPCDSSFPTYDGSCNHPNDFSRAMTSYERLVKANYCDGQQQPRCARSGRELPSERTISLTMREAGGAQQPDNTASYAFTAWGQYLTHDIIQTPDVGKGQVPCNCQPNESCKNISIDRSKEQKLSFPCMFVIRSSSKLGMNADGKAQREQLNQLTPMIDATTVYGVSKRHVHLLTEADGMHLKMDPNMKFGDFLPNVKQINDPGIVSSFETSDAFNEMKHEEFVAGDTRVLENSVLASYHTMFARLHNLCVDHLRKENPDWPAMRVFEEARLIVMSATKQITYAEHLPVLLGAQAIAKIDGLKVSKANRRARTRFAKESGPSGGSRANGIHKPPAEDNPQIRQEFLVAAYRFGHAQIPEDIVTANGRLAIDSTDQLKDHYFDPHLVFQAGPGGCLRGAMAQKTGAVAGSFADATQNNLFKPAGFGHGVDLLSINLARGREHGVASYIEVRNFCLGNSKFSKLYPNGRAPAMSNGWQQVVRLYEDVRDIDLYVGVLMEQHMPGAQVGPTAGCIIAEQFIALRKGDRFWHENKGLFTADQLNEIKKLTLAKVMCTTLEGMNRVVENPFINGGVTFNGSRNGVQNCQKIGKLNLSAWSAKAQVAKAPEAPTVAPVTSAGASTTKPNKGNSSSNSEKQPNVDVGHTLAACRLSGPRKKGIFMCGNNEWNNESLRAIISAIATSDALPIRGKSAIIKGFPKNAVRRISLSQSKDLDDTKLLKSFIAFFPNLNELDISGTNFAGVDFSTFEANQNIFHFKAIGSPSSCIEKELAMKLEFNLKKNLKRFIFL